MTATVTGNENETAATARVAWSQQDAVAAFAGFLRERDGTGTYDEYLVQKYGMDGINAKLVQLKVIPAPPPEQKIDEHTLGEIHKFVHKMNAGGDDAKDERILRLRETRRVCAEALKELVPPRPRAAAPAQS